MKQLYEFDGMNFGGNYFVSDCGDVYSLYKSGINSGQLREKPIKLKGFIVDGYRKHLLQDIHGNRRSVFAHQLVLDLYKEKKSDGVITRHLDGNRLNNHVDNLLWGTFKDNYEDMIKHGSQNYSIGSNCSWSIINENDALNVKKQFMNGKSMAQISKDMNIKYHIVCDIVYEKTWKHVRLEAGV